jgi:hypothetical protein
MKHLFSAKPLIAAALALSAIGATSVAQAQSYYDGRQPIAVGERYGRDHRGGPFGDADRDGIPNRFDRDSRFFDARATRHSKEWSDFDRDGVVNKFDRFPRNPRRS